MTHERHPQRRTHQYSCDKCGEILDTEQESFGDALDTMKREGWTPRLSNGQWRHYCGDCK